MRTTSVRLIATTLTGAAVVAAAAVAPATAATDRLLIDQLADGMPIPQPLPYQPPTFTAGAAARGDAGVQATVDKLVRDGAVGVSIRTTTPSGTHSYVAGNRRVWTKLAALPNSAFRAASNTKSMVATLVMQNVERGRWSLDTTVDEIAPGLVPGHGDITVEQLLSHTSGMPDGLGVAIALKLKGNTFDDVMEAIGYEYTDAEIIQAALYTPWLFDPGTSFSYSNAGYVVLGQLLEREHGQDLAILLQRRVFGPAGMTESKFPSEPGLRSGSLVDAARSPWRWYSLTHFDPDLFSAAGAVVTTTNDINKFTKALNSGRLVSQATLAEMRKPRDGVSYGLGIFRVPDFCTPPGQPQRWFYGHDGASFGTFSIALSSADGKRQVSGGLIGRYYFQNPATPQPFSIDEPLVAAILSTC